MKQYRIPKNILELAVSIVDLAIIACKRNFEMYETHGEIFNSLTTLNKLNVMDATDILKCSKTVQPQLEGGPEGMDLRK
jgi:hypothetical protein